MGIIGHLNSTSWERATSSQARGTPPQLPDDPACSNLEPNEPTTSALLGTYLLEHPTEVGGILDAPSYKPNHVLIRP